MNDFSNIHKETRPDQLGSVLQDWVMSLPRRHQGVLMGALRGCDGMGKNDHSKYIIRFVRAIVLVAADSRERSIPGAYMYCDLDELKNEFDVFVRDMDGYPLHFIQHLFQALQVIGAYCPFAPMGAAARGMYMGIVKRLHLQPENFADMHLRLIEDRISNNTVVD